MTYNFYAPTRVLFGTGQLNHLHEQAMPGEKAMVVISNGKSPMDCHYHNGRHGQRGRPSWRHHKT